ncbi:hypothetical protein ACHJH3_06100 [Campylobacter sp. MOP7]|uniref:hypothetical protein n=1 Tax=Campylobacter canis TaxID=3378588 RepID=UPI00387ED79B
MYTEIISQVALLANNYLGITQNWTLFVIGFIQAYIILAIFNNCGTPYRIFISFLAGFVFIFCITDPITDKIGFRTLTYLYFVFVVWSAMLSKDDDDREYLNYVSWQMSTKRS